MKHCVTCNKRVNVNRTTVDIGIAKVWNEHCEECGGFVDSGFIPKETKVNDNG